MGLLHLQGFHRSVSGSGALINLPFRACRRAPVARWFGQAVWVSMAVIRIRL